MNIVDPMIASRDTHPRGDVAPRSEGERADPTTSKSTPL